MLLREEKDKEAVLVNHLLWVKRNFYVSKINKKTTICKFIFINNRKLHA